MSHTGCVPTSIPDNQRHNFLKGLAETQRVKFKIPYNRFGPDVRLHKVPKHDHTSFGGIKSVNPRAALGI